MITNRVVRILHEAESVRCNFSSKDQDFIELLVRLIRSLNSNIYKYVDT